MEALDKDEMNRDEDLALADRSVGPLVLPGPSLTSLTVPQVEAEAADVDEDLTHRSDPNTVLV